MRQMLPVGTAVLLLAACGGGGSSHPATARAAHASTAGSQPPAAPVARTAAPRQPPPSKPRHAHHVAAAQFRFVAAALSPALRSSIGGSSWHPGCPVPLDGLRYVRIAYWGFDHRAHLGEMVVSAQAVPPVRGAFRRLFSARFPIRRMRLVDHYGASDYASIQADNTSAFNCRNATGSSHFSQHAYGLAIDVNPIENPYVYTGGGTAHRASRPYLDRGNVRPGMAVAGGPLVRAFESVGWGWGGRWPLPTDYQHFSADGR